jgi:hypothetical protein
MRLTGDLEDEVFLWSDTGRSDVFEPAGHLTMIIMTRPEIIS